MLGQILGTIGSYIGGIFGGGIFSTIGRYAGQRLGSYLERPKYETEEHYHFKNIHDSFNFSKASYGEPIALIFGTVRVDGKIIWASQVKEIRRCVDEMRLSKAHHTKNLHHTIEAEYFLSFAVAICEGEIAEVARIWAQGELLDIKNYKFRLYHGSEEQMPDPLIIASQPDGKAPAFRGLAYIILEDLPLADFNHSVPNFSFEVTRKANIKDVESVEDTVTSIVMIPGSGEFVYDPVIQHKLVKTTQQVVMYKEVINSHNHYNIANSVHSLNQLQLTCSNLEWIAVVVCWFGDNLDAGKCIIKPAVEFQDSQTATSEEWKVGTYSRRNARLIAKDLLDNPRYGGSVNDASVIRYLQEIKKRNLKVMFYPMFFLDVEQKPWRGHVTGSAEDIGEFFNKNEGYNNFIIHYAKLVKDHVDAFVIGSELIGLTKVGSGQRFPAVDELVGLAQIVKGIVGPNVLVTYAADWSEYHHTAGGWYNLDPLWSSPAIDFIGIDAYFPATRKNSSAITTDEMLKGWRAGEGYDFYYDNDNNPQPLSPEYAWKNLRFWWENYHKNPDGQITNWQPKMKKIWFTEFGFPSIDKATNQPNVFFDPLCSDGGVPRYSSGEVDFSIQRKAIKAFIDYWRSEEYMGQLFLWCWDARPYPAWPHMNIWLDGYLWQKGHWVNNKFGAASIAAIILELSARADVGQGRVKIYNLDESVEGIIFNSPLSIGDVINILRIGYFFDITALDQEQIKFIKRGQAITHPVNTQLLIKLSPNSYLEQREIAAENIINKIEISFIDHCNDYQKGYCQVSSEKISNKNTIVIHLPFSFSYLEAERLGQLILKNASSEDRVIRFIIPANSVPYEPCDFIAINYYNYHYTLRIIEMKLTGMQLEITGIFDDVNLYYQPASKPHQALTYTPPIETRFKILELPFIFPDEIDEPYLVAWLQSSLPKSLFASGADSQNYSKIANLTSGSRASSICQVLSFQQLHLPDIFLIDETTEIIIYAQNLEEIVTTGWNLAFFGNEIIRFKNYQKIQNNHYKITCLIRGMFATEEFINSHQIAEDFILIEANANLIPVSPLLENQQFNFKVEREGEIQNFTFENKSQKLLKPFITHCQKYQRILTLKWQTRENKIDNWITPQVAGQYDYLINLIDSNASCNFSASVSNLDINLDEITLSGSIKISIITTDQAGRLSPAATIKYII